MNKGEIYYVSKEAVNDKSAYVLTPGRPAIVVSTATVNAVQNTVCVVFLTSKPKLDVPSHFVTHCKGVTGTALCEEIVTVDKAYVGKYVGKLTDFEMQKLNTCLSHVLDLEYTETESENSTELCEKITELTEKLEKYKKLIHSLIEGEV